MTIKFGLLGRVSQNLKNRPLFLGLFSSILGSAQERDTGRTGHDIAETGEPEAIFKLLK